LLQGKKASKKGNPPPVFNDADGEGSRARVNQLAALYLKEKNTNILSTLTVPTTRQTAAVAAVASGGAFGAAEYSPHSGDARAFVPRPVPVRPLQEAPPLRPAASNFGAYQSEHYNDYNDDDDDIDNDYDYARRIMSVPRSKLALPKAPSSSPSVLSKVAEIYTTPMPSRPPVIKEIPADGLGLSKVQPEKKPFEKAKPKEDPSKREYSRLGGNIKLPSCTSVIPLDILDGDADDLSDGAFENLGPSSAQVEELAWREEYAARQAHFYGTKASATDRQSKRDSDPESESESESENTSSSGSDRGRLEKGTKPISPVAAPVEDAMRNLSITNRNSSTFDQLISCPHCHCRFFYIPPTSTSKQ
jgi:hypothetical protein